MFFQVLIMYAFLALLDVELYLVHPSFPESNICSPGTKHVLGVICHEVSKDFTKKA